MEKQIKDVFTPEKDDLELSAKERYFRDLKEKLKSPKETEKRLEKAIENLKKKWRK